MTILNNIYSINAVKSFSYSVKNSTLRVDGLKTGTLNINGIKIKINSKDSLEIIVRKINAKKKYTQIEARLIKSGSEYRLILCSRKQKVNIIDYDAVLLNLHKKKLLGINNKCLIQIVRKRSGYESNDIIINYKHIKEFIVNNQVLDESNKLILSTLKFMTPLVSSNEARNQIEIPADNFDEIIPEILETVQPMEGRVVSSLDNIVKVSDTVLHSSTPSVPITIGYEIKSPFISSPVSLLSNITTLPRNKMITEMPKMQRVHTPVWKKGERIARFNKVVNYVFARTSADERRKFGLTTDRGNIKYKSEDNLNIPGKILTSSEITTKKLYEIYSHIKRL